MCVSSLVHDYMRQHVQPTSPYWTNESVRLLEEVLRKLDELDQKLKQPECVDPEKAKYLEDIKKSLTAYGMYGKSLYTATSWQINPESYWNNTSNTK